MYLLGLHTQCGAAGAFLVVAMGQRRCEVQVFEAITITVLWGTSLIVMAAQLKGALV